MPSKKLGSFNILLLIVLIEIFSVTIASATVTAQATGLWSANATWSTGTPPTSSDDVVIPSGFIVTADGADVCNSITINAATVANGITISGTNSITVGATGTGTVTINAATSAVNSTLAVGAGTLTCGAISITGSGTGSHNSQLTVSSGTINCASITFSGTAAQAQVTFTSTGSLNISGTLGTGGTLTAFANSIVNFNGTSAQTVPVYTYSILKSNNTAGISLTGTTSIATLTIGDITSNSVFTDAGQSISTATTLNLTSGTYNCSVTTLPWGTINLSAGTTVNFSKSGAQTINSINYPNLTLSGSGVKTMQAGTTSIVGTFNIAGTSNNVSVTTVVASLSVGTLVVGGNNYSDLLSLGSGSYGLTIGSGGLTINSSATFNGSNSTANVSITGNLTNSGTFDYNSSNTATYTISGNLANNGTFNFTTGTCTLNGASMAISGSNSTSIANLKINGTITNNNLVGLTVTTALTGTGTLTQGVNSILNITGASSVAALDGSTNVPNTVNYNGTSQTILSASYSILTIANGSANTSTLGGNVTVNTQLNLNTSTGKLSVAGNTLTIGGTSSPVCAGNWWGVDASIAGSTIVFTNTAAITLPSDFFATSTTVQSITMNGSGGVTMGQAITIGTGITFTNGILTTTTANIITVTNNATTALSAGSINSFISGPVLWDLATNSGGARTYLFPVGCGGKYLPFSFSNYTATPTAPNLTVQAFSNYSGGSAPATSYLSGGYWSVGYSEAITTAIITLGQDYALGNYSLVATSATVGGTYSSLGGSISGNSITATIVPTISSASTKYYTMMTALGTCSSYSGTIQVGPRNTFNSISHAIALLTSCGYTGNITLELQSTYIGTSTYENFPITFSSTIGSSSLKTITINPASNASSLVITSTNTTSTILLSGVKYVTIDGRPGASGSGIASSVLSIKNTSTAIGSTGGAAILFQSDAQNNIIQYVSLSAQNTGSNSPNSGVVNFLNGVTTGNSNNTIQYCTIDGTCTAADPASTNPPLTASVGVYSSSTVSTNTSNSILNNEFKGFFNNVSAYLNNYGIYLGSSGNQSWTISNNSFYDAVTRIPTINAQNPTYTAIDIETGDGYTISGNYIGGSAAQCSGTWTVTYGSTYHEYFNFTGMKLTLGTTNATNIQGNTIKGFAITNYCSSSGFWYGINITSGKVNIGTTSANTIGDNTVDASGASASIEYLANLAGSGSPSVYAINVASASTVAIQNNVIGGFQVTNGTSSASYFYGIYTSGSGTFTISSNTLASSTQSNNIYIVYPINFYGIYTTGTAAYTVNANTLGSSTSSNVFNLGEATYSYVTVGIENTSTAAVTISNNAIGSFTINGGQFIGIQDNASATGLHKITGNTVGGTSSDNIYILSDYSGTSSSIANMRQHAGIQIDGTGTYAINSNTVQNITLNSTVAQDIDLVGILYNGSGTYNSDLNVIEYLHKKSSNAIYVFIRAMYFRSNASSALIQQNRITNLKFESDFNTCTGGIYGISVYYPTLYIMNNFISLDNENYNVAGYYPQVNLTGIEIIQHSTLYIYYNTIKISGSLSHGAVGCGDAGSLCFSDNYGAPAVVVANMQNNIFYNARALLTGCTGTNEVVSWAAMGDAPSTANAVDYNYYSNTSASNYAYNNNGVSNPLTSTTFNSSSQSYGGSHSIYAVSSPIIINSDASLSTGDLAIVGYGLDLSAVTGGKYDINGNYIPRGSGAGHKGCYEDESTFLPIELLTFNATPQNNTVLCNWVVATQTNNDYFTIEKTKDGINFEFVAQVKGAGTTSKTMYYSTTDEDPFAGTSYYRLKQTDYDGHYTYSDLVPVNFNNGSAFTFEVFPNPNNGTFNVTLNKETAGEVRFEVYDMLAKDVYSMVLPFVSSGPQIISIDPEKKLAAGVYLIVGYADNNVYRKKVVVN